MDWMDIKPNGWIGWFFFQKKIGGF